MQLPVDMLNEIHTSTMLKDMQLHNILVLNNVPMNDKVFTQEWIKEKIIELAKKHMARILNIETDIIFVEKSNAIVVILDGWTHFRGTIGPDGEIS